MLYKTYKKKSLSKKCFVSNPVFLNCLAEKTKTTIKQTSGKLETINSRIFEEELVPTTKILIVGKKARNTKNKKI